MSGIDAKLAMGALVIGAFMLLVTIIGLNVEPKKQSDKKIIYKQENSWIWQPQKSR